MKRFLVLLVLPFLLLPSFADAAVGFGAISAVDNAVSRTSVAVSGTDTVGIVFVAGESTGDTISTVTWGGSSMTKIAAVRNPSDRWISAWCINNPTSSGTITFADNVEDYWRNYNAYYTGAVCPPVDSFATSSNTSSTLISVSTTVVDAGSWVIMFQKGGPGGTTYVASDAISTMRANVDDGDLAIADSNAASGAGSKTATLTGGSPQNHGGIAFSIAPAGGAVDASYTIIFD